MTRDRPATSQPKKNSLHAAGTVLILLLGALIYSNSFQCSFHFDSLLHIVYNNAIRNLSDVGAWWNYLPNRPVTASREPVTIITSTASIAHQETIRKVRVTKKFYPANR